MVIMNMLSTTRILAFSVALFILATPLPSQGAKCSIVLCAQSETAQSETKESETEQSERVETVTLHVGGMMKSRSGAT